VVGSVRLARVADPETNATPPRLRMGPPETFSWLPEKPLTASTFLLARSCTATVAASCESSCVSASIVFSLVRLNPAGTPGIALPPFQSLMNVRAQLRWSRPADAAGPVNGPVIAIVAFEHGTTASAIACVDAGFASATVVAVAAISAAPARTMALFIAWCPPGLFCITSFF
jgi:hypothetical protein